MSHGLTNIVYAESTGEFRSALESATTQSKLCFALNYSPIPKFGLSESK